LSGIAHRIVVLSGKGGVGKSTVAVNLAVALARAGQRVGLLDVDIHGPSVPTMLQLQGTRLVANEAGIVPVAFAGLKIMSIGFLLAGRDDAVIWRGPLKMSVIKQFLQDVAWGELDYLVVDCPPGTGDEPLSVCQLLERADGAVVVTTPQEVATADVRRCITFCRSMALPVLGVIENMSGFVCPKCGELTQIFKAGGGERMAGEMDVRFLGRVPIDPALTEACDVGTPYVISHEGTETAKALENVVVAILAATASDRGAGVRASQSNGAAARQG
jgi:Mrp family chromosome partitioning ATPase